MRNIGDKLTIELRFREETFTEGNGLMVCEPVQGSEYDLRLIYPFLPGFYEEFGFDTRWPRRVIGEIRGKPVSCETVLELAEVIKPIAPHDNMIREGDERRWARLLLALSIEGCEEAWVFGGLNGLGDEEDAELLKIDIERESVVVGTTQLQCLARMEKSPLGEFMSPNRIDCFRWNLWDLMFERTIVSEVPPDVNNPRPGDRRTKLLESLPRDPNCIYFRICGDLFLEVLSAEKDIRRPDLLRVTHTETRKTEVVDNLPELDQWCTSQSIDLTSEFAASETDTECAALLLRSWLLPDQAGLIMTPAGYEITARIYNRTIRQLVKYDPAVVGNELRFYASRDIAWIERDMGLKGVTQVRFDLRTGRISETDVPELVRIDQ